MLRGFSDSDAINQVIDLAAKKKDEKAVTKLVDKMKADGTLFTTHFIVWNDLLIYTFISSGIPINKRTVLVLRDYATKLVSTERTAIEAEEAKELAELDAQLKQ